MRNVENEGSETKKNRTGTLLLRPLIRIGQSMKQPTNLTLQVDRTPPAYAQTAVIFMYEYVHAPCREPQRLFYRLSNPFPFSLSQIRCRISHSSPAHSNHSTWRDEHARAHTKSPVCTPGRQPIHTSAQFHSLSAPLHHFSYTSFFTI
uniref:Uncharacterized protein n=1 Tax=Trypanosoma vivax (strain Y486) TaxID=1055687 RepID=G0U109_TRYVY|nr:hypothetical protein, unlikely [Trypanosoma vivax Y486]